MKPPKEGKARRRYSDNMALQNGSPGSLTRRRKLKCSSPLGRYKRLNTYDCDSHHSRQSGRRRDVLSDAEYRIIEAFLPLHHLIPLTAPSSTDREACHFAIVLQLLPDSVCLADVMPFLEGVLRHGIESGRNLAVFKQLRKSENLHLREELSIEKQQRIMHTSERACSLCYKRIGPSVFVVYPNKSLAHYLCHSKQEPGVGSIPPAIAELGAGAEASVEFPRLG
eukprot:gene23231-30454_t